MHVTVFIRLSTTCLSLKIAVWNPLHWLLIFLCKTRSFIYDACMVDIVNFYIHVICAKIYILYHASLTSGPLSFAPHPVHLLSWPLSRIFVYFFQARYKCQDDSYRLNTFGSLFICRNSFAGPWTCIGSVTLEAVVSIPGAIGGGGGGWGGVARPGAW